MRNLSLFGVLAMLCLSGPVANAQNTGVDPELQRLQGRWQITELIDNGRSIPNSQIKDWLPSGGTFEVIDNTMVFSSASGERSAKSFSIDPTTYPKQMMVSTPHGRSGIGIYKFDNERLVVCIGDPTVTTRPEDFSARSGSRRMLMVVEKSDTPQLEGLPKPPAPAPRMKLPPNSTATARFLSDVEVTSMLAGTWRFNDGMGLLDVTINPNGTFNSSREIQDMTTFHSVFVQSPVSAGTWDVKQGKLNVHVTTSTRLDRINQTIQLTVRSISAKDLIYVDYLGRVGQAAKLR